MASPQEAMVIRSRFTIELWDHDPGQTCATLISPDGGTTVRSIDMKDYTHFVCAVFFTSGSDDLSKLEILTGDDTSFTNSAVVKDSGTIAVDALGDWAIEECSWEECVQEGLDAGTAFDARYVAGRTTQANADVEGVALYIAKARKPQLNLTPQTTIA